MIASESRLRGLAGLRRPAFELYPAELAVLVMLTACIGLYTLTGIPAHATLSWRFYRGQMLIALQCYGLALICAYTAVLVGESRRQRRSGRQATEREIWLCFRRRFGNLRCILRDLRWINTFVLILLLFNKLKHLTPLINTALFDQELAILERRLLGGRLAGEWLVAALGLDSAGWMSAVYWSFYPFFNLIALIMLLQRREALAHQFFAAFAWLWVLALALIFAVPTWGPCFSYPELFERLPATQSTQLQSLLWSMKLQFDADRLNPQAAFLISGLPSLHVAVPLLSAIFLAQLHRGLAGAVLAFALLIAGSTLFLGWHYLLDDLASVPLVLAAARLSGIPWRARGPGAEMAAIGDLPVPQGLPMRGDPAETAWISGGSAAPKKTAARKTEESNEQNGSASCLLPATKQQHPPPWKTALNIRQDPAGSSPYLSPSRLHPRYQFLP